LAAFPQSPRKDGIGRFQRPIGPTTKGQAMPADDSKLRTRASLLLRLRAEPDDQAAWKEFVARYGPLIYGWCRRWRVQPADAEDIAQNVLLKLAHHLRNFSYDPARRFRGLLRTLTHHAWSDFVEGWRRAVPGSGDSTIDDILDSVPARDDLVGRLEAGFDQELLELASARVRERVEAHSWEAFRLTALEGCSGAEAAKRLGVRVGAVFKTKNRIQKMLSEEVQRLESEESSCLPALAVNNSAAT
jgi:RNA polymerase sigma factor (sigma-70 family)